MKKTGLFVFLLMIVSWRVIAQKQEPRITITSLTKNYYVCTSYGYPSADAELFPANSLFVVTDAGIVLIDTPWGEGQTHQLIQVPQVESSKMEVDLLLCKRA